MEVFPLRLTLSNGWWRTIPWFILCSILPMVVAAAASYNTPNETILFQHMAVDPVTGRVYVGATNRLFQFDSNLRLEHSVLTGPVDDDINCFPGTCSSEQNLAGVDNVNKLLVIDENSRRLVVCGSVYQGACRRHSLDDISDAETMVPLPVAANDETSTTVAFVGPARYMGNPSNVLYVATTNSRLGPYRDMVPAICSRSLEVGKKLFAVIEKSFLAISRVDISSQLRDYYLVDYVYGFHSGDYVYFATLQRRSHLRSLEEWGYISRLARVCVTDAAYDSYVETTLQCLGSDGRDYNLLQDAHLVKTEEGDVLVGVFAASRDHTARSSGRSAICVFSMAEVEHRFTENIHLCYNGSVPSRDMNYIAGSIQDCPEPGVREAILSTLLSSQGGNIFNFCGESLKLNGTLPITSFPLITYDNITLSSVVATTTSHHVVAFIGTRNGSLKKVLIGEEAEEFEEVVVDEGFPILQDMYLDPSENHVYVASPYKMSKIRVEECGRHEACDQCLRARNPYCGWCSLEKKCTVKTACQNSTLSTVDASSPRWLSLNTQQCIDFQAIRPEHLPRNTVSVVELVINQLPQLPFGAKYMCVFGRSTPVQATVTDQGLACLAPVLAERPPIPTGKDHVSVDLAVRSSETNKDFLNRLFAFYDCSVHKTCTSCVTSSWACSWCPHENKCTHNVTICSRTVISGENNPQNSLIKGRQHCPSFKLENEILLPSGVPKEITIEVRNLPSVVENFQCVIEIEGAKERVLAIAKNSKIICSETAYTYQAEVGKVTATLTVLWNDDTYIDKTNVTLYKCPLLGSHGGRADCSLCLTRDRKYQCAWCDGSCKYGDSCLVPVATTCPPPRIDYIHPLSGPIEGGTLVTIEGSNLGTSEEEVRDNITIGGIPCILEDYSVSVRISCRTGQSPSSMSGDVLVGNKAGVTLAKEKFSYKVVELSRVQPNKGPQSGGTRLYLIGSNLNVGSHLKVMLDDLPCNVDRTLASNSQISCRTTRSPVPNYNVSTLKLFVDKAILVLHNPFSYRDDPIVKKITPLKSFVSGGRAVTVSGVNFLPVQQPRMIVYLNDTLVNETICEVRSDHLMVCPSPSVSSSATRWHLSQTDYLAEESADHLLKLRIGFIMDGVESVRSLQDSFPSLHSDLIYVTDPKFFVFENNGIKLYKGESLVIEGENLRLASTEPEVNVTIGTRPCNLTALAYTQLVCLPPEMQPSGTDEFGRQTEIGLPLVVVRVGRNLRFEVGYMRYEVTKSYELPPEAVGGIAAGGAVLVLLSIVILAVLRHKNSQAEREYKRIQLQMDTLENSVRSECKQAFAELQTDMTDLTNDLETCGIPTLDHKTYVMKVFFPGVYDHPLLQDTGKVRQNGMYNACEMAMSQFEQLVNNKCFLLAFIRTLEVQKSFSFRDRVNVASLLMVILMEKMEYATDVLRALLLQLIEKSVNTKHPQLMLRRTESVVEKMLTNWMALSMYDYLKNEAGSSLFLLFSAIKHQVEKGPVDAITHDARYSLSEERLLREQIDYCTVTVQVVHEDQDEKIVCRVNDCDVPSQVKAKLLDSVYKNTPFSLRPSIHDVDLEWRHGRGGHLTLADEDVTTKTVNGWRRLNTLRHYGVRDSAVMSLVNKQNDSFSSNCTGHASLNSVSPIVGQYDLEQGLRLWHLVKYQDDQANIKDYQHKSIPEIFLTRLLSTKGTVQKFVDDFLTTILTANECLPPAVKWLFDLLDEASANHAILDPEVAHAWKSNSLPLRFWVNFIKNPDFVLDIQKTPVVDSCLSVIAQTLMDACSTSEHRLGKDSPSNKLLFAKDIPTYRKMVNRFYQDVAAMPPVTDQEMCVAMQALSMSHNGEFDITSALRELYVYASKYNDQVLEALYTDPYCAKIHLAEKLETVACTLEGEETSVC
ncbi:plexin-B isoform X2 [Parasteatoda tepidariorum]|uniref:plexin-B isoform X2 n=1 Tax=Parasteatoda tepidariorum TaxID=114398 RepID=UPI000A2C0877|nr:plexin-B isoform X2 [Parasteatoda tepidariorum]